MCCQYCRSIHGAENDTQREVRISCPDATGLGCDFARLLLDFGLRILDGARPPASTPALSSLLAGGARVTTLQRASHG